MDSVPLNFPFQFLCRTGQPTLAYQRLFRASVRLNPDSSMIPKNAAVRVCLADLYDLDINRQTLNSGDRLLHRKSVFLFDFIDIFIAEIGILENPCDGKDVEYGILIANGFGWILMARKRDRFPDSGANGAVGQSMEIDAQLCGSASDPVRVYFH
ncbi:hypothetical protein ACU8NH_24310 [Rhizobium leguminosarum]